MRNRETDRQADRQTGEDEYKHIMNIVRRKKKAEGEGLHCFVARGAYVPSTSESKRQRRRRMMGGGRGGWAKGRKDRMKRERMLDQTQSELE